MLGLDNPVHIAFLLVVVLLVFGGRRLPEMGRSLGEGMRGFKDALTFDVDQPGGSSANTSQQQELQGPAPQEPRGPGSK